MTLVFDDRALLGANPGMHVLIVGVGELPHGERGAGPRAEQTFGISGVAGAVVSAVAFYDWLQATRHLLPIPLATVRVLMDSPEVEKCQELREVALPTLENFMDELHEWRNDAATCSDSTTLFFFAGWGFGIGSDIALVLRDFGRPRRPLMSRTVSFDNIYSGMSPSFLDEEIARTQFYFVDAGRGYVQEAMPYLNSVTQAFNLAPKLHRDTRNAPIFYASVAGGWPYSRVGGMSIFGQVLLDCLSGKAAEATEEYRDGRRLWRVSVNSLNAALEREFDQLTLGNSSKLQSYALGGSVKDATICYLTNAPAAKALVFDERAKDPCGPGLHVLIAGVSDYPHGLGGRAELARLHFGVDQLSAAAASGLLFYQWLLANQHRLAAPLKTVRLLLSPSTLELERNPTVGAIGDRCILQSFLAASTEWRDDAATHRDNMTLFYFAGHGVQRQKGDSVLLLEDFGASSGGPLRNTVDIANIFYGMSPSPARKEIARTQLYFVDACRARPNAFKNFQPMTTTAVFEIEEAGVDDRFAPIFHAAVAGSVAYANAGQQTVFSRLLLSSLEQAAVRRSDSSEGSREIVHINSLDQALQDATQAWTKEKGVEQHYALEGIAKDKAIFSWKVPPEDG